MHGSLKKHLLCLGAAMLAGCAAQAPIPLQLVDAGSNIQRGVLSPDSQRIEVTIDGHVFSGFYLVASGAAVSHFFPARRYFPGETVTTYYSNSARAHLTADNGQHLNCEFLFERRRALGECRSPAGAVSQLIAEDAPVESK